MSTTWLARVFAAVEAGKKPEYADLEEGLFATMKELDDFKQIAQQMSHSIASIVVARIKDDTPGVLAAVDDVIKKNVVVKVQHKASVH